MLANGSHPLFFKIITMVQKHKLKTTNEIYLKIRNLLEEKKFLHFEVEFNISASSCSGNPFILCSGSTYIMSNTSFVQFLKSDNRRCSSNFFGSFI